jgi:hypothetical protein
MSPGAVAAEALDALSRRRGPVLVAGRLNKVAAFLFTRLLPRRAAVRVMERATRRLYEEPGP